MVKAAVCRAFGAPLEIETLTLRAPGPGEVEVTLKATAICHSDISFAEGIWGGSLPAIYGHEAAGRISAVGPGVTGWAEGDNVIATLIRSCGTCACCSTGRPTLCTGERPATSPYSDANGNPVDQPLQIGAFAERVVVDQSQIAAFPADMAPEAAALLACGVITGVGAVVHAANLREGEDVVVIGAGGVGLNAIQGARIAGARRIVAVDLSEEKLADARAFGASDGVLASDPDPHRQVKDILGRRADAVIVTVGAIGAYADATKYVGAGGRVVAVGMPASGAMAEIEPTMIASLGQSIVGSKMGNTVLSRDIPWLVGLYGEGKVMLDELISRTWTLDQINEAIADTRAGAARRNVIVFGDA